jgi:hypothetical protein
MGYVNMINEPKGSSNQQLADQHSDNAAISSENKFS